MPEIYVTLFDPETKAVTKSAEPSGFTSLDQVELMMGEPLVAGKRTRTYPGVFYSEYQLHQVLSCAS